MNNHYLEDHDIDEVTYMDENQYAKKLKQEQENKISNALMEFEYSDKSDDNKVDIYPSESYYKRLNNQGITPEEEQFFISKQPVYAFKSYTPRGNAARELNLTSNTKKHKARKLNELLQKYKPEKLGLNSKLIRIDNKLNTLKTEYNKMNKRLDTLKNKASNLRSGGGKKRRSTRKHRKSVAK
jgi:hypothetical protein